MTKLVITAASSVTGDDVRTARLGTRFGRMDLMSQLALLAVESLGLNFDALPRDRTAICLAAGTGSLSTDNEYWKGRATAGGLSPTLFTYTLPSAAIGEIAIRYRLTGPNLCFVGSSNNVLPEALDLIRRGEADGCICVFANVVSSALAEMISAPTAESACSLFLQKAGQTSRLPPGLPAPADSMHGQDVRAGSLAGSPTSSLHVFPLELEEFDRDMESLCAKFCRTKFTT